VLKTDRLVLRPWRRDDVRAYSRILQDPDVMRHWGSGMRFRIKRTVANLVARVSDIEARHALVAMDRHWRKHRFGLWALEERESGALLGNAGLTVLDGWTGESANIEVGWLLARSAWGRGYAVEAGRASLEFAFDVRRLPRIVSVAFTSNWRSERVMQNLGLRPAGRMRWKGDEVVWYGMDRDAWNSDAADPGRRSVGAPASTHD
jgi:RimJ/RimL family protein N-acetyltransferase